MFCKCTSPVVQIPGWNALICQTTKHLQLHLWSTSGEKIHPKGLGLFWGPDTSYTEVDVQLRHVISCAGLSDAAVTGILKQRPLSEPAAHEEPPRTQRLAVLHYGPVKNVPIYQPVNGDITGTWETELDFISKQGGIGGPQRHAVHLLDLDPCAVFMRQILPVIPVSKPF